MPEQVGLPEATSIAVGGMVGGGIFAVLGVVAAGAETAAWMAFALSGAVALCAGYSFVRLNRNADARSAIAAIEVVSGSEDLSGLVGWLLTFGYIGTMAMYAFAFGSYLAELIGVHGVLGLRARPVLSVGAVGLFAGLNLAGARASGRAEDALVAGKVAILLLFAGGGLYYGLNRGMVVSGVGDLSVSALTAAAIAFVAFEGWELLMFDQDSIENPKETIKWAVYLSIVGTTVLYVLVALVTTNLVPVSTIKANPETALAMAAEPLLGQLGFALIALAAVLSTGSALNATLFSATRLSTQVSKATMADGSDRSHDHRLSEYCDSTPTHRSSGSSKPPIRTFLVIGTLTAIFTLYGSLESITSFASGAFMTIFGLVSVLAFTTRDSLLSTLVPAIGGLGSGVALVALLWNLHRTNPHVLTTVAVIWAVVLSVYWVPRR